MDYKTAIICKQQVKPISLNSVSQYISCYDEMMDICDCSFYKLYREIDSFLSLLKIKIPLKSLQKYLNNMAALNKFLKPEITDEEVEHFMKVKKKFDEDIFDPNEVSEKQKEIKDVTWDDILGIFDELKYGSFPHLILAIYCLFPPQSNVEYLQMWLRGPDTCPDDATGYIDLIAKEPYMLLKRHKTVQEKGELRIDLSQSKELCKLIYNSMMNDGRDYLFMNNFVKFEKFENTIRFNSWLIRHIKPLLTRKANYARCLRIISSNNDKTLVDHIKKVDALYNCVLKHIFYYLDHYK